MWAANGEKADVRTVIDTARLHTGARPFQTILNTGRYLETPKSPKHGVG